MPFSNKNNTHTSRFLRLQKMTCCIDNFLKKLALFASFSVLDKKHKAVLSDFP